MKGREAKTELEHEWHEKRKGADTDAVETAADYTGPEALDAQKPEIENWFPNGQRVAHIERQANAAKNNQREDRIIRQQVAAHNCKAEHH